jgi:hypothetical protein
VHYINAMNDTITETPAGGLLDPAVMEELKREHEQGCWFWLDWEIALMYRDFDDRMSQMSARQNNNLRSSLSALN